MKDDLALGLKENWRQFLLLVVINAFVGGMTGLEVLPRLKPSEKQINKVIQARTNPTILNKYAI